MQRLAVVIVACWLPSCLAQSKKEEEEDFTAKEEKRLRNIKIHEVNQSMQVPGKPGSFYLQAADMNTKPLLDLNKYSKGFCLTLPGDKSSRPHNDDTYQIFTRNKLRGDLIATDVEHQGLDCGQCLDIGNAIVEQENLDNGEDGKMCSMEGLVPDTSTNTTASPCLLHMLGQLTDNHLQQEKGMLGWFNLQSLCRCSAKFSCNMIPEDTLRTLVNWEMDVGVNGEGREVMQGAVTAMVDAEMVTSDTSADPARFKTNWGNDGTAQHMYGIGSVSGSQNDPHDDVGFGRGAQTSVSSYVNGGPNGYGATPV